MNTALKFFKELLGDSNVTSSPEDLQNYGQDWSQLVKPDPSLVLFPRTTDEVSKILRYCFENNLSIVPSGGRTGLSGGACAANGEIVLSMARMNKIFELDPVGLTLKVQAGAITQAIHEFCEPHGLTWPVDFASKGSSQVGGNINTNAGGIRVIRYGNTRNWVLGLTAVLMDGTILHCNGALEKNNTGYDFRNLIIGSEGTIAVVTEAILKLTKLPEETVLGFFGVKSFEKATELFKKARNSGFTLSAFELIDKKCYREVCDKLSTVCPIEKNHDLYVLVEFEVRSSEVGSTDTWLEEIFTESLVEDGVLATSPKDKRDFWKIREGVAESIMTGGTVYQQDVSVPVAKLGEFYNAIEDRYAKTYPEFEVFFFGHFGDGNLHIFIRKPKTLDEVEFKKSCELSSKSLFEFVEKFQGSVSAEHGIGILKRPVLKYSRSEAEISFLNRIKQVFDPKNLLNPGKLI